MSTPYIFKCGNYEVAAVKVNGQFKGAFRSPTTFPFWVSTEGYSYYEKDGKLHGHWSMINHPFSDDDNVEKILNGYYSEDKPKAITEDKFNMIIAKNDLRKHKSGRFLKYDTPGKEQEYFNLSIASECTTYKPKQLTKRVIRNLKIGTRRII